MKLLVQLYCVILVHACFHNNRPLWPSQMRSGQEIKLAESDERLCIHGEFKDGTCRCKPCWTGTFCNEQVNTESPVFRHTYDYFEVTSNIKDLIYNASACQGGPGCPCEGFIYTIKEGNALDVFDINLFTGELKLKRPIEQSEYFTLVISVENKRNNLSDSMELTVMPKTDIRYTNLYSPEYAFGYESADAPHHIVKREAIPSNVLLNLLETTPTPPTTMQVGTRMTFRLEISFSSTTVDMLVEIFAPDNENTVMIICDVTVTTSQATNLQFGTTPVPIKDTKIGEDVNTMPDRVVVDFGSVSHIASPVNDILKSTVYVDFEVVMIPNANTVNNENYYISAGAEYDNGMNLWVGQRLTTTVIGGAMNLNSPTFNMAPSVNVPLGSSTVIAVDMYLPLEYATYTFDVFTPFNTTDVMSICGVKHVSSAANFGCGNANTFSETLHPDPSGKGNYRGTLSLGTFLNKGALEGGSSTDHLIRVQFIAKMYDDVSFVGNTYKIGVSLTIDSSSLWLGEIDVNAVAAVDGGTTPTMTVASSTSNNVNTLEPFTLNLTLTVPQPVTAGEATKYVLEILAPVSGTAIFKICHLEILSVGRDLPCLAKDDLVPVYSSTVSGSTVTDKVTLNFGYVVNVGQFLADGDDQVLLQVVLATTDNAAASNPSTWTISFGMEVGGSKITLATTNININGDGTETAITSGTAPTFSMAFSDLDDQISVGESANILTEMTTQQNIYYPQMNIEFMTPEDGTYTYIHICKAKIETAGKNMPCLTKDWYNDFVSYTSTLGIDYVDQATLNVGSLCNKQMVNDANEDKTVLSLYIKVLDVPPVTDGSTHDISVGVGFSTTSIWIGTRQLTATRGEVVTPTATSIHTVLTENTTAANVVIGTVAVYSYLIKIPPQDRVDLTITASTTTESLSICGVRVIAAGDDLPCVMTTTQATYTYHTGGGKSSASLYLGIVRNFGSTSVETDGNFDSNSIITEVLVQAAPGVAAGTHNFAISTSFASDNSVVDDRPTNSITTTTDSASVDTAITTSVTGSFADAAIAGGSPSADIALGESKKVVYSMVIPDSTMYQLTLDFIIPTASVGKMKICYAAIIFAGSNIPCVNTKVSPTYSPAGGEYTTASFDLGYLCNKPLRPGNTAANTLEVELLLKLLSTASVTAGDQISVTSVVTAFGTQMVVDEKILTVTDTFVGKVLTLTGITNETIISLDQPSTITMTIGEKKTIIATVTVPTYSSAEFLFDVDLPFDSKSACLTVSEVRLISSGKNLGCVEIKQISFNISAETNQADYILVDLGIVVNTGLTHRLGNYIAGDDDVVFEIDIQMADCSLSVDGYTHILSIGNAVSTCIIIYDHDIVVSRDNSEKPDLLLTVVEIANALSNTVTLDGFIEHSQTSSAEAHNTSIYVYLAPYQRVPTSLDFCNKTHTLSFPASGLLVITFDYFFFVDKVSFTVDVETDPLVAVAEGYNSDTTTCYAEIGTEYNSRGITSSEPWWPYPVFTAPNLVYSVSAGAGSSCSSVLGMYSDTIIQDCQLSGSPNFSSTGPPKYGRKGGSNAWVPYVRDSHKNMRYLQVSFVNKVKVTKIDIQQDEGYPDMATVFQLSYSNDAKSWWIGESIDISSTLSTMETVTLTSPQTSRFFRIAVVDDDASIEPRIGLKFEFYGCIISGSLSGQALCTVADPTTPSDFYWRSFVVDTTANIVYVCDVDPNTIDTYSGHCQSSSDGNTWQIMDSRLASVIGYDPENGRVYGYSRDRATILVTNDNGVTWYSVDDEVYIADSGRTTWIPAKDVPWDVRTNLNQVTPHGDYTIGSWGATYQGMHQNSGSWSQRQRWTSCC